MPSPLPRSAGAGRGGVAPVDVVLAAGLLLLGLAPLVDAAALGPARPLPVTREPGALLAAVVALQALPLLVRSSRPAWALLACAAASAASVVLGLPPTAADLAPAVALHGWARRARAAELPIGAAVACAPLVAALALPELRPHLGPAAVVGFAVPFVVVPVAAALLQRYGAVRPTQEPPAPVVVDPPALPGERLTAREREVLGLLADGLTNREIAAALGTSYETAKTHVARARRKIGARDRTAAAVTAARARRPA